MMFRLLPIFLFLFALLLPASALDTSIPKGAVVVAPLKGEVSEAQFFILRRALKSAEAADASAFVIDMDTYGGRLDSAVKILDLLLKSPIPTYTWVNTNAGSAGALIALATNHIYMAPVSAIGAAAPVMGGGQEIPETMNEKTVSYFSGYFRSAAESNGYNPELAEAFINKNKEVQVGDQVISEEGSLLTLSAQEAAKKIDDERLLAEGIAANLTQLLDQAGLEEHPVFEYAPSGFEQAARWITAFAPLFLLGGIVGAYIEFKSPGFGIPGLLSAVCFALFFGGHYVAGLTGYEAAALFVAGFLLILFEILFFPGVFFIAATGLMMMLGALFFAMVDFWPSRPFTPDLPTIGPSLLNFSIAVLLAAIVIGLLARYLPSMPVFRFLFLQASTAAGPSLPVNTASVIHQRLAPGDKGVTRSNLRPSGKVEFGAYLADATTEGEYISSGTPVEIRRIEGGRPVVEEITGE